MRDQIFFETERLLLRTWKQSDEEVYIKMNQDKEVMKYFPQLLTQEATLDHIQKIDTHFQEFGYGLYAMELKDSNQFIGFTGFSHPSFNAHFTPCIEIGWRINASYWQMGLGTEAAKACLNFGFQHLGFEEIYSFTSIHNLPSEKLMQKIGMEKLQEFDHPKLATSEYLCRHVLYHIKRSSKSEHGIS